MQLLLHSQDVSISSGWPFLKRFFNFYIVSINPINIGYISQDVDMVPHITGYVKFLGDKKHIRCYNTPTSAMPRELTQKESRIKYSSKLIKFDLKPPFVSAINN